MSSTIDEQFVEYIVKSLVNNPDDVVLERTIDEKGVLLELTVNPDDLGRVIGKRGATAQSIRTLLRALGTKNEARYNLKIVDNGEQRSYESDSSSQASHDDGGSVAAPVASDDDEVVDETESTHVEEAPVVDGDASLADKTRRELEDLDDLDI